MRPFASVRQCLPRVSAVLVAVVTAGPVTGCADGSLPASVTGPSGRASLAASPSQTSAAQPSTSHVTVPVAFSFASGTCGLTTNVSATGEIDLNTHGVVTPTGTARIVMNARASGTGVGDDGSRYLFSYNQKLTLENVAIDPTPVRVTDVFHLVEVGGGITIRTGFVVTADLSGGQLSNVDFTVINGDPFNCDPI